MKYKDLENYLIAVDLDGTLISGFDQYDVKSFELLKEIAKKNYVVIATGRPFRSSKYYYDLLELNTPIINYNGAWVHHPKDTNFDKKMIRIDRHKLINFIEQERDILDNVFCEIEDDIFLLQETEDIKPYLHLDGGNLHVGEFKEILNDNPNGAIIFAKPGSEDRLDNYVNNIINEQFKIRHWFVNTSLVCEFYNPLTSKANAIKRICEYYNIDPSKTICIGDGHNDIEMLEFAKIGVAMGNSHPDLIKHASVITDDVLNHGVYNFFMMDINDK